MNADSGKSPLRYADTPTSAQTRSVRINDDSSLIDYSSRSFREAKEAINTAARAAAARNLGDLSRSDGKTKQIASAERNYTTNNAHDSYRTHDNYSNDSMQKYGHENGANSKRNQNAPSADNNAKKSGMRVRRVGNTTIVTHHRDPYSFYWQLDQVQRREKSPPRPRFQQAATTIVDEVSELEEDEAILDDDDAEERPNPVEKTILSPDSNDSGVNMENYYSKPYKEPLPNGWEKHKDPSGYSYYWHVDSGVIQREPPPVVRPNTPRTQSPPAQHHAQSATALHSTKPTSPPPPPQPLIMEEHAFRQITTKRRVENNRRDCDADDLSHDDQFYIEFTVRSLGGAELAEEDLRDAECSINAAIASLSRAYSYGNASAPPPPLQYANGAELLLKLDDKMLTLQDARTNDVLDSARVHNIRIWGVAKENPHEFAYVTRDPRTRRFFCHAFRCESAPAIDVANALRDLCTRIVHTHQNNNNNEDGARSHRPTSLGFGRAYGSMTRDNDTTIKRITRESLLLTPTEEPQRLIRCFFIGITQVPKATGIDTLNEAVDRLVREVGVDRWLLADVSVAPSAIRIHEASPTAPLSGTLTRTRPPIAECRVRFLSFLGIGRDIKHCAFIMHSTGADSFLCYVFRVEPNAALMAKTIEGACKLRYQKVLDAYLSRAEHAPIHAITGAPITTTTTYSC